MSDVLYGDEMTLLKLSGLGISPYSARGITQTLELIEAAVGNQWRTINGGLIDVSAAQFRKFHSSITCNDQNAAALDGIWPGMQLTVECVATLCYRTSDGAPTRTVVPGSARTEGDFTIYRPQLIMRVINFNTSEDEWQAQIGWTLELEEI